MVSAKRTPRDERRRRLGQNFLQPGFAERIAASADLRRGELIIEIGAGAGALTLALAGREVEVIAVVLDPTWAKALRRQVRRRSAANVRVVTGDALAMPLPDRPYRVMGNLPYGRTTAILRRLLDDPRSALRRADLVVQWEVARKRAALPPTTLLSTTWAPWWQFALTGRVPASAFRPVPPADGGVLVVTRRDPPLLPPSMAPAYRAFLRRHWPFPDA